MSDKDNEFEHEENKIVFPDPNSDKGNEPSRIKSENIDDQDDKIDIDELDKEINENNTVEQSTGNEKKKKSKVKKFFFYTFMNTITLGLWSRFFTVRDGKKGSWFLFAFFMFLINAFFITEKFFKNEFNEKMTSHFGESAILIPENLFDNEEKTDYKSLYEKEKSSNQNLSEEIRGLKENNSEYDFNSLKSSLNKSKEKVKLLESELEKANVKANKLPDIAFISFDKIDGIIGCTSKFAERKKVDIFNDDYINKWVQFKLIITKIHEDRIELKDKNGVKSIVYLDKKGSGYELLVDDEITITFILKELGGCEKPYVGERGFFSN